MMVLLKFKQKQLLLGCFVLLAFWAQSIVPSGYMPKFGTGKLFEITICHGAEMATLVVDEDMQPVKAGDKDNNNHNSNDQTQPCVFASISGKYLSFQPFLFQPVEHLIYERFAAQDQKQIIHITAPKSYLAQAPPMIRLII